MKRFAILTAAVLAGVPLAAPSAHAGPVVIGDPNAISDVAERVMPSVVNVSTTTVTTSSSSPFMLDPFFGGGRRGREQYGKGLGSGVIVSAQKGLILTNNHVVANARDIQVSLSDGTEYDAELVGADPKSDLAVLRLKGKPPANLVALPFGSSSKLRLGEVVLAVGNPLGVGQTVTMGIVSAKGRANMGIAAYEDFIQTDAAINPGNSGGPLVNLRGELVGVNTAIASRTGGYQGIGFSIPSDMVGPIMRALIDKGKVTRGWLGVGIQDVDRALVETLGLGTSHGVLVTQVASGSPAQRAGLRQGDVIVSVGGKPTLSTGSLRNVVATYGSGNTVPLEYFRGKQKLVAKVAFTEAPSDGEAGAPGGGEVGQPGKLGLRVEPVSPQTRRRFDLPREVEHGVVVTDVVEGSTAAELGLQPGDVILEVNRARVRSARDLEAAFKAAPRRLAMLVYRDGSTVYLMVEK